MNAPTPTTPAPDPGELPYPGYAAEMAAIEAKAANSLRARSEPLPGALSEAFAGSPRVVHGFTFLPVTAWMVAILKRIGSPLLELIKIYQSHSKEIDAALQITDAALRSKELERVHVLIAAEQAGIAMSPDSALETVFVFVTLASKCQSILDLVDGRKSFTQEARALLGHLHPLILCELEAACGEHFADSFATALRVAPVQQENGGTVFTAPPAGTASAGGSKL